MDTGPHGGGFDARPVVGLVQLPEADILGRRQVVVHVVLKHRADPSP